SPPRSRTAARPSPSSTPSTTPARPSTAPAPPSTASTAPPRSAASTRKSKPNKRKRARSRTPGAPRKAPREGPQKRRRPGRERPEGARGTAPGNHNRSVVRTRPRPPHRDGHGPSPEVPHPTEDPAPAWPRTTGTLRKPSRAHTAPAS